MNSDPLRPVVQALVVARQRLLSGLEDARSSWADVGRLHFDQQYADDITCVAANVVAEVSQLADDLRADIAQLGRS